MELKLTMVRSPRYQSGSASTMLQLTMLPMTMLRNPPHHQQRPGAEAQHRGGLMENSDSVRRLTRKA